jgi:hypothetical protein
MHQRHTDSARMLAVHPSQFIGYTRVKYWQRLCTMRGLGLKQDSRELGARLKC